jgi:hypothetical protein
MHHQDFEEISMKFQEMIDFQWNEQLPHQGFDKAHLFILPSTSVTDHSNFQFLHNSKNNRVQRWSK